MKITWLGQAGLLFETGEKKILIDPYLSDSVAAMNPKSRRQVPVDERFLKIQPDVIILTHNHADHTDMETLCHYLKNDSGVLVLASKNAWAKVREFKGNHNYVMFNRHTVWTEDDISFRAVKAEHSDEYSIGVIIKAEGKRFYITGDTLFNTEIFEDLPEPIDYVFLPINGCGNNMNMAEAQVFCEKIGATAIPMHCGLFDDIDMHEFGYARKVVPEFFKEIIFQGE